RRSLRGRQISRLVSCVRPLFFGHDLCPDRLSLPVQPIPGGWSWDRTAARWRCTRPHHAPASWTRWRHTAYDRLRPVSCTGASSSVRFSVHRRPCCAPIRCCAPIQGLDIIISYSLKIRKLFSSRSKGITCEGVARPDDERIQFYVATGVVWGFHGKLRNRNAHAPSAVPVRLTSGAACKGSGLGTGRRDPRLLLDSPFPAIFLRCSSVG